MIAALSANAVALAAAIGGPAVALAAIVASGLRAQGDRKHALELAQERHRHERELASGARLFDRRADLYVEALALSGRMLLLVERMNPTITFGAPQEPPEPLSEEYVADLQARASAHGSTAVWGCLMAMSQAIRDFQFASAEVDRMKADPRSYVGTGENPRVVLDERRAAFVEAHDKLRTTIQAELEAL